MNSTLAKCLILSCLVTNIKVIYAQKAFIATDDGIMAYDAENYGLLEYLSVGEETQNCAISTDGNSLYASGGQDSKVLLIDAQSHTVLEEYYNNKAGGLICLSSAEDKMYLYHNEYYGYQNFDGSGSSNVWLPRFTPSSLLRRPGTDEIWLAYGGRIMVSNTGGLDTTGLHVSPLYNDIGEMVFDPSGDYVYKLLVQSQKLLKIHGSHKTRIDSATFSHYLSAGLAISSDGDKLYVLNATNTAIEVISATTMNHIVTLSLPVFGRRIFANPYRNDELWVTPFSASDHSIYVVDAGNGSLKSTIPLSSKPNSVVFSDVSLGINAARKIADHIRVQYQENVVVLRLDAAIGNANHIAVYNLQGQLITMYSAASEVRVNKGTYASGIYTVEVRGAESRYYAKFICP